MYRGLRCIGISQNHLETWRSWSDLVAFEPKELASHCHHLPEAHRVFGVASTHLAINDLSSLGDLFLSAFAVRLPFRLGVAVLGTWWIDVNCSEAMRQLSIQTKHIWEISSNIRTYQKTSLLRSSRLLYFFDPPPCLPVATGRVLFFRAEALSRVQSTGRSWNQPSSQWVTWVEPKTNQNKIQNHQWSPVVTSGHQNHQNPPTSPTPKH